MTLDFDAGTCGLIGPNGAGKTTFFNVLSGFVRPAEGSVTAFGEDLLAMAHFRRARWGVRRTFQTEQAIEELSIYDNVAMVHEHSSKQRIGDRRDAVLSAIEFVGLERRARRPGSARSARASGAWSRWRAPSWASPAWSCSTSRRPGCPRRRASAPAG